MGNGFCYLWQIKVNVNKFLSLRKTNPKHYPTTNDYKRINTDFKPKMNLITYYAKNGMFWIRILNKGFSIKDTTIHPLLFSERNNYTKTIKIGKYCISTIK